METRHYIGNKTNQHSKSEKLQRSLLILQQRQRIAQQARIAELKIAEIERSVIPVGDMDVILVDLAGAISSQARAWPSRLMGRLQQYVKPGCEAEVFALLTEDTNGFLLELKTMQLGNPEIDPDADPDFDDDPDDTE